jgi:hypothetical protein
MLLLLSILIGSGCGSRPSTLTPFVVTQTPAPPVVVSATPTSEPPESISGPLFVNPDNRRYFTDGVKVNGKYRSIYFTGVHTWCNFMDCGNTNPPVKFDYEKYLDFLRERNYNFFRLWRAENARGGEAGPDFWFDPLPYQRSTTCCAFDGGNKFDLSNFNQAYFDRMRERVIEAGERGIYVSIMLFDGWSVESKFGGHNPWVGHPYKLSNNVNSVNGDMNGDAQGSETHTLANPQITALQETYVRKVIDTVNDLDNVLYEISNESPGDDPVTPSMDGSKDWQYHMILFIKDYEATKPKQHPVGMTFEWLNGNNDTLYQSPADWISLGGNVNLDTYSPPVTDGSKVIMADTDHLCGICGNRQWVWKSFTHGENPIFMDIYDNATSGRGMPFENHQQDEVRQNMIYAKFYSDRMNLTAMKPRPDLCSTGFCMANPVVDDAEYLVFLPTGTTVARLLTYLGIDTNSSIYMPGDNRVDVDLTGSSIKLMVEWFNPADGTVTEGRVIQGGASQSFTAPFAGDAVLYIYDANRP